MKFRHIRHCLRRLRSGLKRPVTSGEVQDGARLILLQVRGPGLAGARSSRCVRGCLGLRNPGSLHIYALCLLQVTEVPPTPARRPSGDPAPLFVSAAMSGPGNKRAAGDGGSGPPEKKLSREEKTTTTLIEPIRLGGISSTVRGSCPSPHNLPDSHLCFPSKSSRILLPVAQAWHGSLYRRHC